MDTLTKVQNIRTLTEEQFKEQFPELAEKPDSERKFNKAAILDAFGEAFYILGGVPGLAVWAAENSTNRGKFYGHMARLGASNQTNVIASGGPLIIRPALPPTALDDE